MPVHHDDVPEPGRRGSDTAFFWSQSVLYATIPRIHGGKFTARGGDGTWRTAGETNKDTHTKKKIEKNEIKQTMTPQDRHIARQ